MVLFMQVQHQIQRQLAQPSVLDHIGAILSEGKDWHRTALAKQVCSDYGFRDPRGRLQVATCLAALRTLEPSGKVKLPPQRTSGGSSIRNRAAPPGGRRARCSLGGWSSIGLVTHSRHHGGAKKDLG